MTPEQKPEFYDFHSLETASKALLGYFVHTWYREYLNHTVASLGNWVERGWIRNLAEPAEAGQSMLFDFNALDLEKLAYINGIYWYIISCHKTANYSLMHRHGRKQVLYLRGFDIEGSLAAGGGLAMGYSSIDTTRFNSIMLHQIALSCEVFRVLSPKDVYWETMDAQRFFYGDLNGLVQLTQRSLRGFYLNALHWKQGVSQLLDRMDHYVAYVSSITESVLWELQQLDTDDRRGRVTVVFDEQAIHIKDMQLGFQHKMHDESPGKVIWSKDEPLPALSVEEVRDQLARKFLLTTPDAFESNIEQHRRRIAASSSRLAPGARETWLDFQFYPALDSDQLKELRDFSGWLETRIAGAIGDQGIACLPLFLSHIQLRIFMTLLMGEHDKTGRALASYSAVMQGALEFYRAPERAAALSEQKRTQELDLLQDHFEYAQYTGASLMAFGSTHEFKSIYAQANVDFKAEFETTKAAVSRFFEASSKR